MFRLARPALIEHSGSGLRLANSGVVDLENFLINTALAQLAGDVTVNGGPTLSGVALFNLVPAGGGAYALNLTPAASLLNDVCGIGDLTGAQIGVATAAPQVVQEPST